MPPVPENSRGSFDWEQDKKTRIRELEGALWDARRVLERYAAPYNAANDAIERLDLVLYSCHPAKCPGAQPTKE